GDETVKEVRICSWRVVSTSRHVNEPVERRQYDDAPDAGDDKNDSGKSHDVCSPPRSAGALSTQDRRIARRRREPKPRRVSSSMTDSNAGLRSFGGISSKPSRA